MKPVSVVVDQKHCRRISFFNGIPYRMTLKCSLLVVLIDFTLAIYVQPVEKYQVFGDSITIL